jgi:hypothetical protein
MPGIQYLDVLSHIGSSVRVKNQTQQERYINHCLVKIFCRRRQQLCLLFSCLGAHVGVHLFVKLLLGWGWLLVTSFLPKVTAAVFCQKRPKTAKKIVDEKIYDKFS